MECSTRTDVGREATPAVEVLKFLAIIALCVGVSGPVYAADRVVLCEEFTNRM